MSENEMPDTIWAWNFHGIEHGWSALETDGSIKFSRTNAVTTELALLREVVEAYFALADMSITEYAKHVRDTMSWHCLDSATISRWRTWLAALEAYAKWQESRNDQE